MTDGKKQNAVEVSPESFVSMVLHAGQNPTTVVHGFLMGIAGTTTKVTRAIPVCHETPSQPLVEIAMGLTSTTSSNDDEVVVGWYVAPERLNDTHPGPAALRIAASLAAGSKNEPVLILLNNEALASCLRGESSNKEDGAVLKGLGKDFGQQWLEPLPLKVTNEERAHVAAKTAFEGGIAVVDLVNHLDDGSHPDWPANEALDKHVKSVAK